MEDLNISMSAIGIAVVASFVFGFLWYTPLFGKAWAKEMGLDTSQKPSAALMIKNMVVMIFGNFLLAYVFSHNIAAWDYVPGMDAMSKTEHAMMAGMFTWLGFFLPTDLGIITWEGKSFKLFAINTGYHLLNVLLVALILCTMR